jgi:hypothetical protein
MRHYISEYETESPEYEYVAEYEALPVQVRRRLLEAVRALGAECAREAYQQGLDVAYAIAARGDAEALEELLEQYGVHGVPHDYTDPDEQHPIWYAFWRGVEDVPEPEAQAED